jgi:hypothetical protein
LQHWPVGHSKSVVHGHSVEQRWVAALQHWLARQSTLDLQHATQLLPWQHIPEPQSESAQQVLVEMHAPLQQCSLLAHWALPVHAHVPHCSVVGLQHCVAVQSAPLRQPLTHALFLQTEPAPQSAFVQHEPRVHVAPQHFEPLPHCASFVHAQLDVVHALVAVSQHWLARQSAGERHPSAHSWFLQMGVLPPQSEFWQHVPVVHEPPQHFCPVAH